MQGVVLVKLGGSLLTDKSRPETVREEHLGRLAGELARTAEELPGRLIVGHGSGSFGHIAAARWRVLEGVAPGGDTLEGVARTQDLAARLHRRVVAALLDAGAHPFGFAPSSAAISASGGLRRIEVEPVVRALELGLLPVTYGDIVLDAERGCAIASTEALFEAIAEGLAARGLAVREVLWLGETDGIWDADGRRIPRIEAATARRALAAAGGSAGIDVTGGMRLRLETALRLAERGIASWILDGRRPGIVAAGLAGRPGAGGTQVGTQVAAGERASPVRPPSGA